MYKRGSGMGEQHVPDTYPINSMYQDRICHKPPGVTVFVTGDGAGFKGEEGLDATLCNMHNNGCPCPVELLTIMLSACRFQEHQKQQCQQCSRTVIGECCMSMMAETTVNLFP